VAKSRADLLEVASDWSLDASELKASVGKAIMAISDAMESLEAQNDDDIASSLEDVASELYELIEDMSEE